MLTVQASPSGGQVTVGDGAINIDQGGYVTLIGNRVSNQGTINMLKGITAGAKNALLASVVNNTDIIEAFALKSFFDIYS